MQPKWVLKLALLLWLLPLVYMVEGRKSKKLTRALRNVTRSPRETAMSESCGTLAQVSEDLWSQDLNRLDESDFLLNYQGRLTGSSRTDLAPDRFFAEVNEEKLTGQTFETFMSLLDNYRPDKDQLETVSAQELAENEAFLEAATSTEVMGVLYRYLKCRGVVTSQSQLRALLTQMWFQLYPRSGKQAVNDSSGFEHVVLGEYKSSRRVIGLHSWLSFYLREKSRHLDYLGYLSKTETQPLVVSLSFTWNNRTKPLSSFLLGVSPEFDLALFSLCFLAHPRARCPVVLAGKSLYVHTRGSHGHLFTAYVEA